jgi:hypothetical protein
MTILKTTSTTRAPNPPNPCEAPHSKNRCGKNIGKSSKVGAEDVAEAVAQQKRAKGHPYPYESGYGRTGRRGAEMIQYEQRAKRNGRSLTMAVRDYATVEDAAAASVAGR